jgi:hypothetical protein
MQLKNWLSPKQRRKNFKLDRMQQKKRFNIKIKPPTENSIKEILQIMTVYF